MTNIHLLDNVNGQIEGLLPSKVRNHIIDNCSFEVLGSQYAPKVMSGHWDGFKRLFSESTQRFPLGLYSNVTKALKDNGLPFQLIDHRNKPIYSLKNCLLGGISYRPYQKELIKLGVNYHRGIFEVATGGGKSIIIIGLSKALSDLKINIFVHRNTLLRQFEETFNKYGISIGIIGDGERIVKNINICSLQSLLRRKPEISKEQAKHIRDVKKLYPEENVEIIAQADVSIWDETHHLSCDLFYHSHQIAINSYFRFGFSATPYREDNSDLLIQAATGRKIIRYGATELINMGYLVKPHIFFLAIPSMPGLPHDYRTVYKHAVVENEYRNDVIVDVAKRFVEKNITSLISVKEVKHGEILLKKLQEELPDVPMKFIKGEGTSGTAKFQVLKDLEEKKLKIVIATTVFGEGIDVPSLGALINAKAPKSSIDTFQLYGRTLRPNEGKNRVIIVDIADKTTPYLRQHTNQRKKLLETEEAFKVDVVKSVVDMSSILETLL